MVSKQQRLRKRLNNQMTIKDDSVTLDVDIEDEAVPEHHESANSKMQAKSLL